jgi:hypothetical protein
MSRRPTIPAPIKQQILYESAFVCVVCQNRGAQIHHMDENNTNNEPKNLVLLCQDHHDEAHTKHQLSQNLTAARLRGFKKSWLKQVSEKREQATSASSQRELADSFFSMGVTWGYINHLRVSQMLTPEILKRVDKRLLARCETVGMIDHRGIIIPPKNALPPSSYLSGTVYDLFDHLNGNALHVLYGEFVDEIARIVKPIELADQSWTKTFTRTMLAANKFIFFKKAQYFKTVSKDNENAHIRVRTFRRNIEIEYFVDSRDMFGTTSITCSFSGHQTCSSLLQIKSINEKGGKLIIACTPIALGVGFQ